MRGKRKGVAQQMGWEKRERGGSYYYRKERNGNRVCSVYVGSGTAALFASFDAILREEKGAKQDIRVFEQKQAKRQESMLDELRDACEALITATLLTEGFHTHKRQWRKRRNG